MKTSIPLVSLRTLPLIAITAASLLADSQTTPGAGNKRAEEIVPFSEMVKSAHRFVIQQSQQLSGAICGPKPTMPWRIRKLALCIAPI
jgi:hypothetical protein